MSDFAIKAENISKAYRLGEIGTGTLSRDLERSWARIRGKEDPFLKIGEANDRAVKGNSDVVWSLKDINFEIKQGDAVGIIGRNGAGKSTLLKILSRVTAPTTGQITGSGRIASLLEVGTGFHPELTGRENIFLNGAILGMRKHEIKRKFDEIVDFSGVERYVDTPVKRYSSGMYVRLAFAVAAHLESEILIVDEVLAVGDAEFQKKCLGKMGEVSKGEGRTVLFVSHNMAAVQTLCNKGVVLNNGGIVIESDVHYALKSYLSTGDLLASHYSKNLKSNLSGGFTSIKLLNQDGENVSTFVAGTTPYLEIEYELSLDCTNFNLSFLVKDSFETHVYSSADTDFEDSLLKRAKGKYKAIVPLNIESFNTGNYKLEFLMGIINIDLFDKVEMNFSIENNNYLNTGLRAGLLLRTSNWITSYMA